MRREDAALAKRSGASVRGVSIVIPCLNEERTIGHAIREAHEALTDFHLPFEIVVVDNGSEDTTAAEARRHGARVVAHPVRGYGEALRAGFAAATYDYVAFYDADMSYSAADLPRLVTALEKEDADLVLGNRLNGDIPPRAMPRLNRHLGTPTLSWLIRKIHRLPTYDCNSGFRVLRRTQLARMNLQSPGMELASEMLLKAAALKLRYREVDISFRRDGRDRPPHLRRWRDGWRHLRVIVGI